MMAQARPAATVVVLRESERGPEILMLKRSARSGFFPHAWVFPGGRVDDADADAARIGRATGLPEVEAHFAIAAIRETFEEAGVWLGTGEPTEAFRAALNDRSATLASAPGLIADLDRLSMWSWWVTPEIEPKRYDTRFFVALLRAEEAERAAHDNIETVSSRWITAEDALALAAMGDFFLAPPTFRTLEELVGLKTGAEVMAAARQREVRAVMPRLDMADDGVCIVLPGDPTYPSDSPVEGPTRIEFSQGRWWSH
jgi:8-oxo-dGTP pyrophosphatase MutT (NUDIX family)